MTTPTVLPTKFAGTSLDYLKARQVPEGVVQAELVSVSIPSSTASGTVVGLVPFRKGFSLLQGATQLYTADLDTSTAVTFDIGYVYDDNTRYTNDADAFASALTTPQAGGLITFDEFAGLNWVAEADGWIAITTGGGSTTTTGSVTGQIVGIYGA